jgi:hypothetical protein
LPALRVPTTKQRILPSHSTSHILLPIIIPTLL